MVVVARVARSQHHAEDVGPGDERVGPGGLAGVAIQAGERVHVLRQVGGHGEASFRAAAGEAIVWGV